MLEKGKISAIQMGLIAYPMILGTSILAVPTIMGREAERDMWISPIFASSMGFLSVYLAYRLNKLYADETLIQYSEQILGRFLGKILGFFYLFFLLENIGNFLRQYAEFTVGAFLPQTPRIVIISCLTLLCAFVVYGGIEVLGRLAQLYIPLLIVPLFIMVVLLLRDFEIQNMFPIMMHGITPSISGAMIPGLAWFTEFFVISFLLPFLTDRKKGKKWGMISVLAVTLTMVVINLTVLFLFGGMMTSSYLYPVFEAARYIRIGDFFEHLEAFIMVVWVAGIFLKISVFYYALVLGTAQWLKLSDYRPVVFPYGLLMIVFGIWAHPNIPEMTQFYKLVSPLYKPLFLIVIPLCLLFLAMIRKKHNKKKGERQQ
ncbi:spore gernimation protein [Bacillus clarus]|uniref:Spore germination family protein n=1 Tax=Bacillus clarus TaxID=2338372 RepID=A0A090ZGF6_9BACI|nr:endospore germination permease [Bacillus clarus]KFN03326.1 spore germination family protein [Bacillus clarus]RFT65616.1 spore gernimation protein [Bacillus clarus]